MDNFIYEGVIKNLKPKIKDIIIFIVLLIIIWFFIPRLSYNWSFKLISIDLLIRIIVTSILIIIYCYKWIRIVKKNKSSLPGIAFYINSSINLHDTIRKDLFFESLKEKLKDKFKIIIYEREDLEKQLKNSDTIDVMKKLNITILFEIMERTGMKNSQNIYEIKFKNTTISFPHQINGFNIDSLAIDLNNSINSYLEISSNNELKQIDSQINYFEIMFEYIISIILICSNKPQESFKYLDNISLILNCTNMNKKKNKHILHIKKNIPFRYIEAYKNRITNILSYEPYYKDGVLFEELRKLNINYGEYFNDCYSKKIIDKKSYEHLLNDYRVGEAIILYDSGQIDEAYDKICMCNFNVPSNATLFFNKAFLLANKGMFKESYKLYKRLSERKDISEQLIISITRFIEKRFEIDTENIALKFCLAITNYYFKDKLLAETLFEELIDENGIFKKIYNELIEEDN